METVNCESVEQYHEWEFKIAAFGSQCFECKKCGQITEVLEDSQP